jgi:hypothetical protein
VAVDAAGDVIVVDTFGAQPVVKFSPPSVVAAPSPLTGTTARQVLAVLSRLNPGTLYFYRVVAMNSDGTTVSIQPGAFVTPGPWAAATGSAVDQVINAAYPDHANDKGSDGAAGLFVRRGATMTTPTSDTNPAAPGQPVTFIAPASDLAPGTDTPTGPVSFYDGTTLTGTVTPEAGAARPKLSTLGVGSHTISAVYRGDTARRGSSSPAITQVIG